MKRIVLIVMLIAFALAIGGCTEADKVSKNVSMEADNFNVTRRLVVTNVSMMTSPTILYTLTGNFSINTDNVDNQLEVTSEVKDASGHAYYKKDFIRLNEYVTYVVQDLSGADVTPYRYEINFLPESVIPVQPSMVK